MARIELAPTGKSMRDDARHFCQNYYRAKTARPASHKRVSRLHRILDCRLVLGQWLLAGQLYPIAGGRSLIFLGLIREPHTTLIVRYATLMARLSSRVIITPYPVRGVFLYQTVFTILCATLLPFLYRKTTAKDCTSRTWLPW